MKPIERHHVPIAAAVKRDETVDETAALGSGDGEGTRGAGTPTTSISTLCPFLQCSILPLTK